VLEEYTVTIFRLQDRDSKHAPVTVNIYQVTPISSPQNHNMKSRHRQRFSLFVFRVSCIFLGLFCAKHASLKTAQSQIKQQLEWVTSSDFFRLPSFYEGLCSAELNTSNTTRSEHSKKNLARYCHKCEHVFMYSTGYFYRILMKLQFLQQIFEKSSNIKIHQNSSKGSRVVPCGWTDGRTWRG
jgi:hypothetical protein